VVYGFTRQIFIKLFGLRKKRLVGAHGGQITVQSEMNRESAFSFTLPAEELGFKQEKPGNGGRDKKKI
jgi:hypothetical protein